MIQAREIQPLIIVGVYNTGYERLAEYTHVKDKRGRGGRARAYGKLIVKELKPMIDQGYRTLPDAQTPASADRLWEDWSACTSAWSIRRLFGKLMVMSPSVWWANAAILREVSKVRHKIGRRSGSTWARKKTRGPKLACNRRDICAMR